MGKANFQSQIIRVTKLPSRKQHPLIRMLASLVDLIDDDTAAEGDGNADGVLGESAKDLSPSPSGARQTGAG